MPPRFEVDLDPCEHVTADAIGQPGQRVFYVQGWEKGQPPVTVLIEKAQLQSLAIGVEQFLADVARQNPSLEEASPHFMEVNMRIHPPVDPLFRVGEIGLGYDQSRDRVVVIMRELLTEDQDPESAAVVRFWCSRSQLRALSRWGADVSARGRPLCPQCGQPMEPEGHFCPKKNGHKH
ncbi:MAG TPA: DUF3090 domain-containing protein [Anaerolineales bacterium]|nr:DUF3090 domain-containing protein [Anaerolineales bacterium]